MNNQQQEKLDLFPLVELFGHTKIAGRCTEQNIAGTTVNNQPVAIIEPVSQLSQLTRMLDKINEPKIVFKYGIRMQDSRKHILYITKNRIGYVVCVEGPNDRIMQQLSDLSATDVNSLIQRLKLDYSKKVKNIK